MDINNIYTTCILGYNFRGGFVSQARETTCTHGSEGEGIGAALGYMYVHVCIPDPTLIEMREALMFEKTFTNTCTCSYSCASHLTYRAPKKALDHLGTIHVYVKLIYMSIRPQLITCTYNLATDLSYSYEWPQ